MYGADSLVCAKLNTIETNGGPFKNDCFSLGTTGSASLQDGCKKLAAGWADGEAKLSPIGNNPTVGDNGQPNLEMMHRTLY